MKKSFKPRLIVSRIRLVIEILVSITEENSETLQWLRIFLILARLNQSTYLFSCNAV